MVSIIPVSFHLIASKIFVAAIIIAIISCNNSNALEKPDQGTPKAWEDQSYSSEIISKRSYDDDLLENLYRELLEKNKDLKNIENKIQELHESKNDSTALFERFKSKSQSYYVAANGHSDLISDSLLKIKMKMVISNSLAKYNSSISHHHALLKTIDAQNITVADLHTVLKITRTLALIEKYQNDNLPSTKPMEGLIQKQKQAIKLADKLIDNK